MQNSATGTRTRVARVRAEYPNQLDYSGFWWKLSSEITSADLISPLHFPPMHPTKSAFPLHQSALYIGRQQNPPLSPAPKNAKLLLLAVSAGAATSHFFGAGERGGGGHLAGAQNSHAPHRKCFSEIISSAQDIASLANIKGLIAQLVRAYGQ